MSGVSAVCAFGSLAAARVGVRASANNRRIDDAVGKRSRFNGARGRPLGEGGGAGAATVGAGKKNGRKSTLAVTLAAAIAGVTGESMIGESSSSGNHNNNSGNNNGSRRPHRQGPPLQHGVASHLQQQQRRRWLLRPPRASPSPSPSSSSSSSSSSAAAKAPSYVDGAPPSINAESFDESSTGVTEFVAETKLPTDRGFYRLRGYRHSVDGAYPTEPVAIVYGDVEGKERVPVRVHDACFTSEVLGSLKCDCKQQLQLAMEYIQENDGMIIYLHQEGRGIGLANKIAAYAVQDEEGLDTVDANRALGLPDDVREYTAVANILEGLGIKSIQLMTNNPRKVATLERLGVAIEGRIPCIVKANLFNQGYLEAKEGRMKHYLDGSWCYWDHSGNTVDEGDVVEATEAAVLTEGGDVDEGGGKS